MPQLRSTQITFLIKERAVALGIKNPYQLHKSSEISYDTVKKLWYNETDDATLSVMAEFSRCLNCRTHDLYKIQSSDQIRKMNIHPRQIVMVSDDPETGVLKELIENQNFAEVLVADDFNSFGSALKAPNLSGAIIDMTLQRDAEEIIELFSNVFPEIPAIALYEGDRYPQGGSLPASAEAVSAFAKPMHPATVCETLINYIEEAELVRSEESTDVPPNDELYPTVKTIKAITSLPASEFFPTAAPGAYISAVRMLKTLLKSVETHVDADMQNMLGEGKVPSWQNVEHITDISYNLKKIISDLKLGD